MAEKKIAEGELILSFCGKCKEPTMHTIMTLMEEGIADKCECTVCKAKHKYRDPVTKTAPKKSKTPKAPPPHLVWKEAMGKSSGNATPYSMKGSFEAGQLLDHSTFGQGIVDEVVTDKKIKVVFEEGLKTLVQNQ